MKVLHVLASNKFSGAENVVCQIIKTFSGDKNFDMVYASPDGPIRETLKEKDIKFFPLKKLSKKELKRVIKEYDPDIVHAHDFRASVIAGLSTDKNIISHLHNNPPWIKKKGILSRVYSHFCKKYKKILTVSDSVFEEFVYGKKHKDKVFNIGNPINIKYIQDLTRDCSEDKEYDICFCGRLTEAKNPVGFIEIINYLTKSLKNLKVIMLGDGELREEVAAKIDFYGLKDNIELTGFVKNPYVFMKKSKLLCLPSVWEGFGLVAVEAMALGLPVVCSNVGGLPNLVDEDCGKLCDKNEDYINEITLLLSDSAYLSAKSSAAVKKAEALSKNNYHENLVEEYNKTINA